MLTGIVSLVQKHVFDISGLIWKLSTDIIALAKKQYISLPGREHKFSVKCNGLIPKYVTHFDAVTFMGHTKKYNYNFGLWDKCILNGIIDLFCLNVTVHSKSMTTYLILGNLNYYTIAVEAKTQYKISWNKAYELCQQFGTNLPSFMSRDEIDEFRSLLLKAQYIPFIEAIFIGLHFKEAGVSMAYI